MFYKYYRYKDLKKKNFMTTILKNVDLKNSMINLKAVQPEQHFSNFIREKKTQNTYKEPQK